VFGINAGGVGNIFRNMQFSSIASIGINLMGIRPASKPNILENINMNFVHASKILSGTGVNHVIIRDCEFNDPSAISDLWECDDITIQDCNTYVTKNIAIVFHVVNNGAGKENNNIAFIGNRFRADAAFASGNYIVFRDLLTGATCKGAKLVDNEFGYSSSNGISIGHISAGCTYDDIVMCDNVFTLCKGPAFLIGNTYNFITNKGQHFEASGSDTGTGSEQPIPHGLAAIPTGCKAWIKIEYPVGSGRYITKDIPFDATNVYPTVDNGVAFEWGIA
jgi:hypothetical protein